MRAVVSRVTHAQCVVDGQVTGSVEQGLLVYVGVVAGDTEKQADWLADKLAVVRVFNDEAGKMNLSVQDVGGGVLLIPNFTLAGATQKGTRPSYSKAAPPEVASGLFDRVAKRLGAVVPTGTGIFGAHMDITNQADGPITLVIDTPAVSG